MSACPELPALPASPPLEVGILGVRGSQGEHECGKEEGRGSGLCRAPRVPGEFIARRVPCPATSPSSPARFGPALLGSSC